MRGKRGALAALASSVLLTTSLGCPSLSDIRVGSGDASIDRPIIIIIQDARPDRLFVDAKTSDGSVHDAFIDGPCSPDLASDARNCGRCGHDCKGGACQGGACQPYALVTGNQGPQAVAVTNGIVYFTSDDGTVEMCPVDGCMDALKQLTSGQGNPQGITTDVTNVYWAVEGNVADGSFAGSVATCGLEGCAGGTPIVLAYSQVAPKDVVVNVNTAFWTNNYGNTVRSCAVGGCENNPTTLVTDPARVLSGVAIDATSVFWAEPQLGNLLSCPLDGCSTFTPLATFTPCTTVKIDVANGMVFWSNSSSILSCSVDGCGGTATMFAANQAAAYAVAHDTENLYWTLNATPGRVLSCPLSGCATPTVVADNQAGPTSVAADSTSIYWTNASGGTVMRLMK